MADADEKSGNYLRPGGDFAMAFLEAGGRYVWWIGRCNQLFRRRPRGSPTELREPVSLDDLPEDVLLSASWYGARDKTRCVYTFDSVPDRELWSLEHYIGSPCLEYDASKKVHRLTNPSETLAALDAALLHTAPAKPTSKRTRGEEAEALSRKRQREAPAWDATVAKTGSSSDRAARAAKTSAAARVNS